LWISSFPYALQQVCLNLIVNASDAIGERGGFVRVETVPHTLKVTRTTRDGRDLLPGDYAAIRVIDNGPGIPDAVQRKIFDPFFSTKGRNDRNGLGLAMVRQIIEETGGDITFESALGIGTRFEIIIPIVDSHGEDFAEDAEVAPIPSTPELHPSEDERTSSSVLFLEDDPTISEGARIILESCGFRVEHYDNGNDGLLALEREGAHFDIVLCDFHLTDMDATEFIRKAVAKGIEKRFVLVTGSLNHTKSIAPEEAYIEEIFEKSISYFTVARRLHAILGNEDIKIPEFAV
jgi:CheY-like chemotaxis protein|tara:strand:+ start:1906 stop:2778 length:873 start_codon:yes stop_codon:yes gene_type:complete